MVSESHPTMGAWIEILVSCNEMEGLVTSHPTMGAWIEIILIEQIIGGDKRRTPRWVRGLKFIPIKWNIFFNAVAPHDGCVD